jgi:tetratricopeptide (TPR) repeat protein
MVQDSLARAGSGATKFLRQHYKKLVVAVVAGVAGTAAVLYFLEQREAGTGKTADVLAKAVLAEQAPVMAEDKRPEEQKALDPMPVFASSSAKADAVLAAYTKVVDEHPGTGPAILAKLGQAGAYLDKNMPDQAFSAYEDVLRTELAKNDVDVRARAMEGKAFALEAKKDYDGALKVFQDLEGVDKTFADLAKYHQARMHLVKGEKDKAKEMLLALKKTLEVPTLEGPQAPHLRQMIEENLRTLDPSLPRPRRNLGGPKGMPSPEELEQLKKQLEEMQKQQGEGHGDDAH